MQTEETWVSSQYSNDNKEDLWRALSPWNWKNGEGEGECLRTVYNDNKTRAKSRCFKTSSFFLQVMGIYYVQYNEANVNGQ